MGSWEERIKMAAAAAAREAAANERGRCLWCIDQVVKQAEGEADRKFALTEQDLHVRQLKVRMMRAMAAEFRRLIVGGLAPADRSKAGGGGLGGAAGGGEAASGAVFHSPHPPEERP